MFLLGLVGVPVYFFGTILNIFIIWAITHQNCQYSAPFLIVTFAKSISDVLYVGTYLFYVTPMAVLTPDFLVFNSHLAAFLLCITFEISLNLHALITINRFVAVFLPFSYQKIFSERLTKLYVVVLVTITSAYIVTVNFVFNCCPNYEPTTLSFFNNLAEPACVFYYKYLDTAKNTGLILLGFFINIVTLSKVQWFRRKRKNGPEKTTVKEWNFLKQTFLQTLCYLSGYIISDILLRNAQESKIASFIESFLIWTTVTMFDGFFTVVFNGEFRNRILPNSVTSSGRLDNF